jgi:hypothetical protein
MISWLISIVAVWGTYQFLERKFKKENLQKPSIEINEIGKLLLIKIKNLQFYINYPWMK